MEVTQMAKEKTLKVVTDNHNQDISVKSSTYSGRGENCLYLECPIELGQDLQQKMSIPDLDRATLQDIMVRGMCAVAQIPVKPSYSDRWFYKPKKEAKVVEQVVQNVSTIATGTVQQAPQIASADKAMINAVKQKIAGKNVSPEILKTYLAKAFAQDVGLQNRIYTALVPQAQTQPQIPDLPDL
jgi:hypothetical protein